MTTATQPPRRGAVRGGNGLAATIAAASGYARQRRLKRLVCYPMPLRFIPPQFLRLQAVGSGRGQRSRIAGRGDRRGPSARLSRSRRQGAPPASADGGQGISGWRGIQRRSFQRPKIARGRPSPNAAVPCDQHIVADSHGMPSIGPDGLNDCPGIVVVALSALNPHSDREFCHNALRLSDKPNICATQS